MTDREDQPDPQAVSEDDGNVGVDDETLPSDLVPGEDNPLAEGLPDGETVEGMLDEGKQAEKTVYGEEPGDVVERTMTGSDSEADEASDEASDDSSDDSSGEPADESAEDPA